VLILTEDARLTLVDFPAIRTLRVEHMPGRMKGDAVIASRGTLRLGSRYPQGLSPELEHALLRAWQQTALDVVMGTDSRAR
jgi:hypothetical protein